MRALQQRFARFLLLHHMLRKRWRSGRRRLRVHHMQRRWHLHTYWFAQRRLETYHLRPVERPAGRWPFVPARAKRKFHHQYGRRSSEPVAGERLYPDLHRRQQGWRFECRHHGSEMHGANTRPGAIRTTASLRGGIPFINTTVGTGMAACPTTS